MQQLGWTEKFHPILLVAEKPCNNHLLTYWERYIEVIRDPLHVEQMLKLRDGMRFETHYARMPDKSVKSLGPATSEVQKEWFRQGRSPLLTLTDADHSKGWETLKKMGVPANSWFVALHAREAGFYNEAPNSQTSRFRNANIKDYTQAIEHIAAAGGWTIRIGDASMQPLDPLPNTIDYARSEYKSELMDVFLCAKCKFFLGSTSGITHLANIFGTPCALVNWCSSTLPCFPTDLFIQKIPYSKALQRALSFTELMNPPYVLELDGKLAEMGFEPQDNSPEEIVELVQEMLGTLDGSMSYSNEDLDLQAKFRAAMDSPYSNRSGCRIGRDFLKRYSHLLS